LRNGFRGTGSTSLIRFFPSHLGLSWNGQLNLSTFTARSVLSMNCEHHSAKRPTDNELICTACSPECTGEKPVSNPGEAIKSMSTAHPDRELFTVFRSRNPGCEKVCVPENEKKRGKIKKAVRRDGLFNFAGTRSQDAFDAAGLLARAAAFLRFR
jgi:hypothetical protein